ncbi:hypothetical protein CCP3SC1AL1_1720005 [Gammaproteobacteria bacterium]
MEDAMFEEGTVNDDDEYDGDEPDWQDYENNANQKHIKVPVKFYCPVCKCDVSKDDAFVVVYSCRINTVENTLMEIPARAFHFNPYKKISCRADLDIRVVEG